MSLKSSSSSQFSSSSSTSFIISSNQLDPITLIYKTCFCWLNFTSPLLSIPHKLCHNNCLLKKISDQGYPCYETKVGVRINNWLTTLMVAVVARTSRIILSNLITNYMKPILHRIPKVNYFACIPLLQNLLGD